MQPTQFDSKIVKVLSALKKVEGGDYTNRTGDSGTSAGAYQWNNGKEKLSSNSIPKNFKNMASSNGLNPNDFSPANQNKVAYYQVEKWKKEGKQPEEIAALWNGAKKTPEGKYTYNNPEYGVKFRKALGISEISEQVAPIPQPEEKDGFFKSLAKAPLTIAARPFQAVAELAGASAEDVNKFTSNIPVIGKAIAPVPKNFSDVKKDVGRGVQTVAFGMPGIASGGAAFGLGASLEQGNDLFSADTALSTAGGAVAGKLLGFVGKPIINATGKVVGKITPQIVKDVSAQGTKAVEEFMARHTILPKNASQAITTGANKLETIANKPFELAGKAFEKTPPQLNTQLDKEIRNIFKGTTTDVGKIDEMAFKARKGLELLQKESNRIKIPDINTPLGSKITKKVNLSEASPNELLSSVLEMDKKIASQARSAVEKAKQKGIKIDTTDIETKILSEIDNGKIQKTTGKQMLKQIQSAKNDPVAIHDWVQDVNVKYGKKYQRGTIDDTATGKLADDVAEILRKKLDSVVDRKGYAEAFGNNQELKRMLVAIAKKANKGVNFGDIATDAGLDLGISVLTGNPAYMARTVGSGLFRGILSRVKNQSGIRTFRKALDISEKLGTKTKLPSSRIKTQAVAEQETKVVEDLVSKKISAMKSILDDIETAQYKELSGGTDNGLWIMERAINKAKENGVEFPLNKVTDRMKERYNNWVIKEKSFGREKIPLPQLNKTQPPTKNQSNINNTTIGLGKTNKAIPSIPKTTQKLDIADIGNTLSQKSTKVKPSLTIKKK